LISRKPVSGKGALSQARLLSWNAQ